MSRIRRATRKAAVVGAALALVVSPTMASAVAVETPTETFVALAPARILDTRDPGQQALAAGEVREVRVTGASGVPDNAGAVALNLTVDGPTAPGWLTAYPCGISTPNTSNLNFAVGEASAAGAIVPVGSNGSICLRSSAATNVIVDLSGWFPRDTGYTGVNPSRLTDTRSPVATAVNPGEALTVQVGGRGGIPSNAAAAALSLTATQPVGQGWLTAYPCDVAPPMASNVNYLPGQTAANGAVVKLSAAGTVCVSSPVRTHVIVDTTGWFADGSDLASLTPSRVYDSRSVSAGPTQRKAERIQVAGRLGIPANAKAAMINVTATDATAAGWLTTHPCGVTPTTSNLNFNAGQTRANLAYTPLDESGAICVTSSVPTHVILDVGGVLVDGWDPKSAAPPVPESVTASQVPGSMAVRLTWSPVATATSYTVTRDGTDLASVTETGYLDETIATAGVYNYKLTVVSPGGTAAVSKKVTVTKPNVAPTAAFTTSVKDLTVTVDGSGSTDPDGTISNYAWDYGDGTKATGAKPAAKTYSKAGNYTIKLTVTDNNGATHSSSAAIAVTAPPAPPGWKVAFTEDFSGTSLDSTRWKAYHNTYGDGNNEQACLTPNNVTVGSGALTITSKKETITCPGGSVRKYSSGFIGSRETGNYYPLYGRYEMRARLPHGQGLWPAFWLRHRNGAGVAEIDIMEYFFSQAPGKATSTLHFPTTLGTNVTKKTTFFETPVVGTGGWHTYAVEIEPVRGGDGSTDVRFRFLIDDAVHLEYVNTQPEAWNQVDPNATWDIAVNTAVGGNWAGNPEDTLGYLAYPNKCSLTYATPPGNDPANCPTSKNGQSIWLAPLPSQYQVDYVRVYIR